MGHGRRLLDLGMDRAGVMSQLSVSLGQAIRLSLAEGNPRIDKAFDPHAYLALLGSLPRTDDRRGRGRHPRCRPGKPGMLVCARAVPDGESRQFVGALFPVAPGKEAAVLDLVGR